MISISYIQCYCHFLLEVSQRGYSVYYGESTSIVVVVVVFKCNTNNNNKICMKSEPLT